MNRTSWQVWRTLAFSLATFTLVDAPQAHAEVTGPPKFPWADPDTLVFGGQYPSTVTYGTTQSGYSNCGVWPTWQVIYVPYIWIFSPDELPNFTGSCAGGDAMPGGPGGWAEPGSDVWAPSVVHWGGVFIMYYTATKAGTGQKCIGRATSTTVTGPFTGHIEVACPGGGRWAIDPDVFVHDGQLYMTYRDDAIVEWPETGLSVVQMNADGSANWSTRRDLLYSIDVWNWDYAPSTGVNVIENPSMMRFGDGHFYLFFSGGQWNSRGYATGVADCGTSPLPASRCNIQQGQDRPYFGYQGPGATPPYRGLPQNQFGPGGMSVFRTHAGNPAVVWHYWMEQPPYPGWPADQREILAGFLIHYDGFWVQWW